MIDLSHLAWPFFDESHKEFAAALDQWACKNLKKLSDHRDVDQTCRSLVRALGHAGWLRTVVPASHGGSSRQIDLRKLCLAREILAWHHGLADFAFAMQGLGSGPISLFGSDALKAKYLPDVCAGRRIAAFALTEPAAGSDVGALATTATADGIDHVRISGIKTWISNGGIADHYIVFARTGEAPGVKGLSAFVVDANTPGLTTVERIEVIAPHPLATLRFHDCRIPVTQRLGAGGDGFKVAMATLDIFRATVGAAALGIARRALHEAADRAATRMLFGRSLGDLQMTQAALAESAPKSTPQRCWFTALPGPKTPAPNASRANRRSPRCSQPKSARKSSTARCKFTAETAFASAARPRPCIGRSVRCASTKAPLRCKRSSSHASS